MYKASLPDRLRYAFDNTMSKGTIALIGLLAALSTLVIGIIAAFVTIVGIAPEGSDQLTFPEAIWMIAMTPPTPWSQVIRFAARGSPLKIWKPRHA